MRCLEPLRPDRSDFEVRRPVLVKREYSVCRKNGRDERRMARNLATDSRRDMDFVSASYLLDCGRNDKVDVYLDDYFGEGLKNVMFCGFYVGT